MNELETNDLGRVSNISMTSIMYRAYLLSE